MIQKQVCNLIKGEQSRKCLLILLFILCPFFFIWGKNFYGERMDCQLLRICYRDVYKDEPTKKDYR